MRLTIYTSALAALMIVTGLVPGVDAEPAPAPDATFLIGSGTFETGQSNNLGPAIKQTIDEYYIDGPCPDMGSYSKCDELRFGLTMFADEQCTDPSISPLIPAEEDGGELVKDRIRTIHGEAGTTFCSETSFRPHDSALELHRNETFGGDPTDETVQDGWWERPRLTMMVVGELPQTNDVSPDNRVKDSLKTACENLEGGPSGLYPSMPTWVMLAREFDHEAVPYAGLLAAAGGTGECCYGLGCDPSRDAINVCAHVDGRTDVQIRNDIDAGMYTCDGGGSTFSVGPMDFGDGSRRGTLPAIRCHLVGEGHGDECDVRNREPTDILGIMSCIRQLPRGATAENVRIRHCEEDGGEEDGGDENGDENGDDCEILTEENGGIEFVDERKTMFMVNGEDGSCDVEIDTCPNEGEYCLVDGQLGRCAIGQYECTDAGEVCTGLFDPMPEICNGLDDDCDGMEDNIADSWSSPNYSDMSLPSEHAGLACNQLDTCRCPDGASDSHTGVDYATYLDGWSGACMCGEGLGGTEIAHEPAGPEDPAAGEQSLACGSSTAVSRLGNTLVVSLFALMIGLVWRTRRRRR